MKSFVLTLSAVMLLAGCSNPSATATPNATSTPAPAASASPEATAVVSQAANFISAWDGDTCNNFWNHVMFTVPDGWYRLTEDQIAQITGAGTDAVAGDLSMDKDKITAQQSAACNDFYISNAAGTATFYSEIIDPAALGVPNMTPEEYLEQTKAVLESMTSITAECDEIADDNLAGNDGKSMSVTIKDADGNTAAIESLFVNANDGMLVSYIAMAKDQDGASQIQSLIQQVTDNANQ